MIPLELTVDPQKHVQLDIVALDQGGFTLCVDKIPHAFSPNVKALEESLRGVINHVFALYKQREEVTEEIQPPAE